MDGNECVKDGDAKDKPEARESKRLCVCVRTKKQVTKLIDVLKQLVEEDNVSRDIFLSL